VWCEEAHRACSTSGLQRQLQARHKAALLLVIPLHKRALVLIIEFTQATLAGLVIFKRLRRHCGLNKSGFQTGIHTPLNSQSSRMFSGTTACRMHFFSAIYAKRSMPSTDRNGVSLGQQSGTKLNAYTVAVQNLDTRCGLLWRSSWWCKPRECEVFFCSVPMQADHTFHRRQQFESGAEF
jgi:hypothetical protein